MKKRAYIIGSGFAGLSAACYLAKSGYEVTVIEKNDTPGGRARQLRREGFTFDMGPTWYWMPDVFERFFADFGKKPSDYYELEKLSPAYRVYFGKDNFIDIADNPKDIAATFESREAGSGAALRKFLSGAKTNYDIAIGDLVYRPGESPLELVTAKTIGRVSQFSGSVSKQVRRGFRSRELRQVLEFPVLFLGAKPSDTPTFYNFMNHADFGLGTWYPKGGMYAVVRGIVTLAVSLGVDIRTGTEVEKIMVEGKRATGLVFDGGFHRADVVVSSGDYHHTEHLLEKQWRMYSEQYWEKRTFAPSALLFYAGFDKKLSGLQHHTLFFDADFDRHARDIYDEPKWPEDPLFYASFPSMTDSSSAPEGKEAGIFLIPLAPGLEDSDQTRNHYWEKIVKRMEAVTGQPLEERVMFREAFGTRDFISAYHSYKGNAYGLANTLLQTAFLRPKLRSRKVKGLYFAGQLTVPGPGVPPALISGKLTTELINRYESIV